MPPTNKPHKLSPDSSPAISKRAGSSPWHTNYSPTHKVSSPTKDRRKSLSVLLSKINSSTSFSLWISPMLNPTIDNSAKLLTL